MSEIKAPAAVPIIWFHPEKVGIEGAFDGNDDGNAAELWRHATNYNERHALKLATQ